MRARWIAWCSFSLLTACVSPPPVPPAPSIDLAQVLPIAPYAEALARGDAVYRIEPDRSEVVIRVYRGGPLARLGHDHVIAGRDFHGYVSVASPFETSRADLYLPIASLQVDDPAKRAEAGFATQPSSSDIEGTRRNMDKVLEPNRYPLLQMRVARVVGELPRVDLYVELTMHGIRRVFPVAAEIDTASTGALRARGNFSIRQTDFQMTPFAILGGALQVRDQLDVVFEIYATRVTQVTVSPSA